MTTGISLDLTTPGPGEYSNINSAINSQRGSMIGFGKQKTYRHSGEDHPRIKYSRHSPGPGRYAHEKSMTNTFDSSGVNTTGTIIGK